MPPPKYIPWPYASMSLQAKPNDIHQADIIYLPHDKYEKKIYLKKYNRITLSGILRGSRHKNFPIFDQKYSFLL